MYLETERLLLIDPPLHVLQRRLETDDFHAEVETRAGFSRRTHAHEDGCAPEGAALPKTRAGPEGAALPKTTRGPLRVHFPPQWPGAPLGSFSARAARFDSVREAWDGIIIHEAQRIAIGMMGFKGGPDAAGAVEFGYGLNPDHHNRGYATEMVRAMLAWARSRPEVRRITAKTAVDNLASRRVLEKAGLVQVGTDYDQDDGDLIVWEYPL